MCDAIKEIRNKGIKGEKIKGHSSWFEERGRKLPPLTNSVNGNSKRGEMPRENEKRKRNGGKMR